MSEVGPQEWNELQALCNNMRRGDIYQSSASLQKWIDTHRSLDTDFGDDPFAEAEPKLMEVLTQYMPTENAQALCDQARTSAWDEVTQLKTTEVTVDGP